MKKTYIVLSIYMIIMAIGLFVCKEFMGVPYDAPNFSGKFLPFMFLLAVFSVLYEMRNRNEIILQTGNEPRYIFSSVLFIPVVGFGIFSVVKGFNAELGFFILIVDTILIGIAEEIMYRRILLGSLARKIHPVYALLLSSVLFCLLHLLNLLGGLSLSEVINQLGSTFVMGMFLGAMYLDTKKIIFPIIFHSAWDYILLSDSLSEISFMPILLIGVYALEFIITILIIIKMIRNKGYNSY